LRGARDKIAEQFCAEATKQSIAPQAEAWIASLSLSSGGASRRPVGSQGRGYSFAISGHVMPEVCSSSSPACSEQLCWK
jgi:hypothetical protein